MDIELSPTPTELDWNAERRDALERISSALGTQFQSEYTPPGEMRYENAMGHYIVRDGMVYGHAMITFRADTREFFHALDTARRALNRLRYPPKAPARGSVSRRRDKLRKAGLRR